MLPIIFTFLNECICTCMYRFLKLKILLDKFAVCNDYIHGEELGHMHNASHFFLHPSSYFLVTHSSESV